MTSESPEQWALRVLSGEHRGIGATLLRGGLALAEPAYAGLMLARNFAYNRGLKKIRRLPRATVSVGNITTGGTGKTPVVRWLAEAFVERGLRPAVLLRGYRGETTTGGSDEQRMLAALLGDKAAVVGNADRVAGAMAAMAPLSQPDVFVLDDAFQHRRAGRDFDLVLVNATQPFGYGHVIPRGLLREPLAGLRRADGVVVTRSDQVPPQRLAEIENTVAEYVAREHIHRAVHQLTVPPVLNQRRFLAFAGIGDPASLQRQLESIDGFVGFRAFGDHHAYDADDLATLQRDAARAGAEILLTTEKDWVKIEPLASRCPLPIVRLDVRIAFRGDDGERLLARVVERLGLNPPAASATVAAAREATAGGTSIPPRTP
jgi:tetraacyldisaccharide 4'-kinase